MWVCMYVGVCMCVYARVHARVWRCVFVGVCQTAYKRFNLSQSHDKSFEITVRTHNFVYFSLVRNEVVSPT